jgi:hypothetical protein
MYLCRFPEVSLLLSPRSCSHLPQAADADDATAPTARMVKQHAYLTGTIHMKKWQSRITTQV